MFFIIIFSLQEILIPRKIFKVENRYIGMRSVGVESGRILRFCSDRELDSKMLKIRTQIRSHFLFSAVSKVSVVLTKRKKF